MNHCRDCNSDYSMPGTCNCFAPGQKRHFAPSPISVPYVPVPYYPWSPVTPYYPPQPWWGTTITVGDFPATTDTITYNGDAIAGMSFTAGGNC